MVCQTMMSLLKNVTMVLLPEANGWDLNIYEAIIAAVFLQLLSLPNEMHPGHL